MSETRRSFLKQAAALSALSASKRLFGQMKMAMPVANVPILHVLELPPFADALPLPVRVKAPSEHEKPLRVTMRETHVKVHRDVPATRMWTYGLDAAHQTGIAPLIEARSGHATHVEWVNELPKKHFLPVDFSLHGCGHDVPEVRVCVHLHGGRTPSKDDGYPEDWYEVGKSRVCRYPLEQEAATLWYHDHAMGLNRLNTYAGMAGMFLVRDELEDKLNLPMGKYELPLVLYDRNFTKDGQLYYLDSGDPEHPWVSEFYGDGILINGKVRPYVEVEPRMYRLRLVNAANSRFFTLAWTDDVAAYQIGCDQGLLQEPLKLTSLQIAPAERADVLVDFSKSAGSKVYMNNNFMGILEFRVAAKASPAPAFTMPKKLRSIERMKPESATVTRRIELNEHIDQFRNSMEMLLNQKHWHEPVTEKVKLGTTEVWEFVNLTEDTHPMHLHLVRFQLLDRKKFDVFGYKTRHEMKYIGEPLSPLPNEMGWKDVVQCPAGVVTRIIAKFDGYPGKYLYHCHVLEHEANDMMRPFEVIA